jgi:glycerol-3-phosphate O-acyltransferase/dihydroxyacetone phosphate acyltransferase
MWLLPHFATISTAAVRVYYRASRSGGTIPAEGPVLVVGNHPNSLLDPAFLAWVAERPLRFLAKEPLFRDPLIGWLVRGSGSIRVYRAQDDPAQMERNRDTFAAAHEALATGSAVAMFPEGISHNLPSIAPLKTGAARIALGAAAQLGRAFPIVPVGLVFRQKDLFRSEAHASVGAPVAWDDLAPLGASRDAVAQLTARIDDAMRTVTLNLARWEDDAVLRTAEAVWSTMRSASSAPGARVDRLRAASAAWTVLRAQGDARWEILAREVRDHARLLQVLRLEPADVPTETSIASALRWVMRRASLESLGLAVVAALASLLLWIPYRATGVIAGRMSKDRDTLSTYRVLVGAAVFTVWSAGLAALIGRMAGWPWGLAVLAAVPAIGVGGLFAVERWQASFAAARRWWLLRADPRLRDLKERQAQLAMRLDDAAQQADAARVS